MVMNLNGNHFLFAACPPILCRMRFKYFLRSPTVRKLTRAVSSPKARLWNSKAMAWISFLWCELDFGVRINYYGLDLENENVTSGRN